MKCSNMDVVGLVVNSHRKTPCQALSQEQASCKQPNMVAAMMLKLGSVTRKHLHAMH